MKDGRPLLAISILVLLFTCSLAVASDGVILEVTGGKADVSDWVAEATLDLAAAKELLDAQGRPDQIAVYELDETGKATTRVASQVDGGKGTGLYTVAWRVPGNLAAGACRRFLLSRGASQEGVKVGQAIQVEADADRVVVTNGRTVLEHERVKGGMIGQITIDGAKASLAWMDYLYDGTVYRLATHPPEEMVVSAGGPLRATIEVTGEYLDGDKSAPSKARAVYRFTNYAGLPFTLVDAVITQDFPHPWRGAIFGEIHFGGAGLTHFATEQAGGALGALEQVGQMYSAYKWAAVYNDRLLIGTCAGANMGIWDERNGGGQHYGAYIRCGVAPMSAVRYPFKAAVLWERGSKAAEDKEVQRWSAILQSPPGVAIRFPALAERLDKLAADLEGRRESVSDLSENAWVAGHVALSLAQRHATQAGAYLSAGRFGEALGAMEACERTAAAPAGEVELAGAGEVRAGMVMGHPYLGSAEAAYLWSRPEDGAGLMSVFDRKRGREYLGVAGEEAPFWQVAVKNGNGGASYVNTHARCEVSYSADGDEGRLRMRWSEDVAVEVEARLAAGDPMLRARVNARANDDSSGLMTVIFPVICGILPLTPDGREDTVLETWGLGWEKPSPLVTGKASFTDYPRGMQFTALLGGGVGLYVAEEDGEANRKELTWTPDSEGRALDFSISHPVLNWGAEELVGEYASSGDALVGPFEGDWYDAARIYRKWALTAPWCAKGPIHERKDYPRWLAELPYWTIAHLSDETGVGMEVEKHAFYEVPLNACQLYSGFRSRALGDNSLEYFPPALGSEGFREAVRGLHDQGIRIVVFLDGLLSDTDTETFRRKDCFKTRVIIDRNGTPVTTTVYCLGQELALNCPATRQWRDELIGVAREYVTRYDVDGFYLDWLNINTHDCYNKDHGHAIGGGNFWTSAVHGLYQELRAACQEVKPECILTGEDAMECLIDVEDVFYCGGKVGTNAPLFHAVYHGYTNVYGGTYGNAQLHDLGRSWLLGAQNGFTNMEWLMMGRPPHQSRGHLGRYYRKLLKCRWAFGTPYLGYGQMLRPPHIEGDVRTMEKPGVYGPYQLRSVEGSAWKAPDGSVGLFFVNYEDEPREFTWTVDLGADAGMDASSKVAVSRWSEKDGIVPLKEGAGGRVSESMTIEGLGMIALKMEETR